MLVGWPVGVYQGWVYQGHVGLVYLGHVSAIPLGPGPCTKAPGAVPAIKGQNHQSWHTRSEDPRPDIPTSRDPEILDPEILTS